MLEGATVARTETGDPFTVNVSDRADTLLLTPDGHDADPVEVTPREFLQLTKRGEWYPKKTGSAFFDALREVRDA